MPPSTLGADLAAMLGEQAGVDVTFVVEDEEMKVRIGNISKDSKHMQVQARGMSWAEECCGC